MAAYAKKTEFPPRLTPQEYLERERKAETKSEYDGGIVTAMAGASWEHNVIASNIQGELHAQLRGKPCAVVGGDLRVRVPACDKYYYPDAVVCGNPQFEDSKLDTLLNPTLVVEVLSGSTEAKDRGEKLICYESLESLNTYVLVSQYQPLIEVYRRRENDWVHSVVQRWENSVSLDAIGCTLHLADVYARIEFKGPQGERDAGQAAQDTSDSASDPSQPAKPR